MKKIAVIPARYASTRFPAKLMKELNGKTIIATTYQNTVATNLFDEVLVATDHEIIFNEIKKINGNVVMSVKQHESGSDRIAEAIEKKDCDVIVNVQGDEPFTNKEVLHALLDAFNDETVQVASLMHIVFDKYDIENANSAKVVIDTNSNALLFSRSVIPYVRDKDATTTYYKHIGIYAYRKNALLQFTKLKQTPLEIAEKLEQLRYLENGIPIKMILTSHTTIGIDTPEDLERAKQFIFQQEKEFTSGK